MKKGGWRAAAAARDLANVDFSPSRIDMVKYRRPTWRDDLFVFQSRLSLPFGGEERPQLGERG